MFGPIGDSVFIRTGDYWFIRYEGQAAILKSTRGLAYIAYLLRHQGREVYVTELIGAPVELPTPLSCDIALALGGGAISTGLQKGVPLLDSKAKREYKRRIDELRKDLQEAEQFNDSYRALKSRSELNAIADRLAAAIGLGGKDRRASSDAERARSAVTQRIKKDIKRIVEVLPKFGIHLSVRIKTGYFCSYNPHPERPLNWDVRTASHVKCDTRTYNVEPKVTLKGGSSNRYKHARLSKLYTRR